MQVTVQKINPPWKPTDDSANFVGTDNQKYYLDIVSHRMLVEGMTIECEAQKRFPKDRSKPPYYVIQGGFSPVGNAPIRDKPAPNGQTIPAPYAQGQQTAPPTYVAKYDELITRLAILKSLIESGALLQGEQSMDDLVEMAWTTAPKLKVWQR
jgi:hypothetical protein